MPLQRFAVIRASEVWLVSHPSNSPRALCCGRCAQRSEGKGRSPKVSRGSSTSEVHAMGREKVCSGTAIGHRHKVGFGVSSFQRLHMLSAHPHSHRVRGGRVVGARAHRTDGSREHTPSTYPPLGSAPRYSQASASPTRGPSRAPYVPPLLRNKLSVSSSSRHIRSKKQQRVLVQKAQVGCRHGRGHRDISPFQRRYSAPILLVRPLAAASYSGARLADAVWCVLPPVTGGRPCTCRTRRTLARLSSVSSGSRTSQSFPNERAWRLAPACFSLPLVT